MPTVVFVCTANICRSPAAQVLLADWLRRAQEPGEWRVVSAGTWASPGVAASRASRQVARSLGLDLEAHRSQELSRELLAASDLIVCMARSHREAILAELPELAGRVHLLSGLAGPEYDVPDPYGGPDSGYVEMYQELRQLIEAAGPAIVALAIQKQKGRE